MIYKYFFNMASGYPDISVLKTIKINATSIGKRPFNTEE